MLQILERNCHLEILNLCILGAGEMSQVLRVLVLAKDPGVVPSIYIVAHNSL